MDLAPFCAILPKILLPLAVYVGLEPLVTVFHGQMPLFAMHGRQGALFAKQEGRGARSICANRDKAKRKGGKLGITPL